jgi:glycosyltransferase involved in cell wall biosynthesis
MKLFLPQKNLSDPVFNHAGDTFRELAKLWGKHYPEIIQIVPTSNSGYVWLGEEETSNGVVLYDRPTLEWWHRSPPKLYKCALFGNLIPKPTEISRAYPWIFWARRPSLLIECEEQPALEWNDRSIKSVFLGKIENHVQQSYRDTELWRSCIEEFTLVVGKHTPYPYSQSEYLQRLRNAKYGLCLRGYGPKCNREIELMAFGTVPIVTPDVDMTGYFDPPKCGIHYFIARTPDEFTSIVEQTPPSEWHRMSRACKLWYMNNCSVAGSLYQTLRIVNTLSTSLLVGRPMKDAWSVPSLKFPGSRRVVIDTVFFERPFSGISRVWVGLLNKLAELVREKDIEIILLLRANAVATFPAHLLQAFPFVGIPTFEYSKPINEDVNLLNGVCSQLQADLFISTYYTYTTVVDCMAVVHDMIPEIYKMEKNIMWIQKDQCLANAKQYMCVSDYARNSLLRFYPISNSAKKTFVVPNSFDASIFGTVDEILLNTTRATELIRNKFNIDLPFALVIATNSEPYKNLRLIMEMVRMNKDYFKIFTLVLLTSGDASAFRSAVPNSIVLRAINDDELGLLYSLATALIYPTKCEGFGLPILEAFWNECPVICCKGQASGINEVGGDACFYVHPDDPRDLFQTLSQIQSGALDNLIRQKAHTGLNRLDLFTVERQVGAFVGCLKETLPLKKNNSKITTTTMAGKIHVIAQYFTDTNEDRQAEYDFCVQANLADANVVAMHFLQEPGVPVSSFISDNPKSKVTQVAGRLTYKMALDYANEHLVGETVALLNLDIFLDPNNDWKSAMSLFEMGIVLCLSRHEFNGIDTSTKDPQLQALAYANAQDCWVFKAPIWVKECEFKMGMLGCDNAIAHRLKMSGYICVNSPNEFKIHHFDVCRGKRGQNFLSHHIPNPEQPEERGFYLLPDYSALNRITIRRKSKDPYTGEEKEVDSPVISIDDLVEKMGLGQIHRYRIVCDIMSNYIKLTNPKI